MISYELLDFYEKVLYKIEELDVYTKELTKLIDNVNKERDILLNTSYTNTVIGYSEVQRKIDDQKNIIIDLMKNFSMDFDVLGNHGKLIQIKQELNNIMGNFPASLECEKCKISDLLNNYSDVTSIIIDYLKTRNNDTIVKLLNNALITVSEYDKFVESYKSIKNFILKTENNIKENEKENEKILNLHFYDEHINPEYFITNLQAIDDSYKIMCKIFNISLSEYELKVLKIESGSLLGKFLGYDKAVDAICYLLEKITNLVFNKFSFEGKILRHKQILDLLEKDAEVTEKYKTLGVDISFDEDIRKYHYQLIKSLGTLVGQTTKVKINNVELVLENNLKEKYLLESTVLLRESFEDTNELEGCPKE